MKVTLGIHKDMADNLNELDRAYTKLGVEVIRLPSKEPNAVFHRDVAAWTPFGFIKCRMGKESRAWEPDAWFTANCIEPDLVIEAPATFEGADLLWLNPFVALVAVGQRTNRLGATIVYNWLRYRGTIVFNIMLPSWHPQHLLGLVNSYKGKILATKGIGMPVRLPTVTNLPMEEYEIKGPNFVSPSYPLTRPGQAWAVLNKDCGATAKTLEGLGAEVVPVAIDQLLAHGGGVACATGILEY